MSPVQYKTSGEWTSNQLHCWYGTHF